MEGRLDVKSCCLFTSAWTCDSVLDDINLIDRSCDVIVFPSRTCLAVFNPSHIVSCVTNAACVLIGSLTWF